MMYDPCLGWELFIFARLGPILTLCLQKADKSGYRTCLLAMYGWQICSHDSTIETETALFSSNLHNMVITQDE